MYTFRVSSNLVTIFPNYNLKGYRYQHMSEMILNAVTNVDVPTFLTKIQCYGKRVYRRLLAQIPDLFIELSRYFIYLDDEERYSCLKCYFVSPRVEKVLEHGLAHFGPMICQICNKAFIKVSFIQVSFIQNILLYFQNSGKSYN